MKRIECLLLTLFVGALLNLLLTSCMRHNSFNEKLNASIAEGEEVSQNTFWPGGLTNWSVTDSRRYGSGMYYVVARCGDCYAQGRSSQPLVPGTKVLFIISRYPISGWGDHGKDVSIEPITPIQHDGFTGIER